MSLRLRFVLRARPAVVRATDHELLATRPREPEHRPTQLRFAAAPARPELLPHGRDRHRPEPAASPTSAPRTQHRQRVVADRGVGDGRRRPRLRRRRGRAGRRRSRARRFRGLPSRASLPIASARLFCSRRTCVMRHRVELPAAARFASSYSGSRSACFTRYSPFICFTISSLSLNTASRFTPSSAASSSPSHQGRVLGHVVRRGADGVGLLDHRQPRAGEDDGVGRRPGVAAGRPVDVHGRRVGHRYSPTRGAGAARMNGIVRHRRTAA